MRLDIFSGFRPCDRLLILVPHPDDETLMCGGLIQQARKKSCPTLVVIATDGNRRGKKELRRAESAQALSMLGMPPNKVEFWDFPDGRPWDEKELAEACGRVLDEFKPTVVVTSDPDDRHPDHARLGRALRTAAEFRRGGLPELVLSVPVHRRGFPRPRGYHPNADLRPPLRSAPAHWLSLILTEEEHRAKKKAIGVYRSQMHIFLRRLLRSFIRRNEIYRILIERGRS